MSDSRERFEAWWLEDAAPVMHASLLAKNEFNEYADVRAQCAYETWQAAERDALERAAKVCEWKQDTDYETEIWHTSCGEAFVFNDGGPDENFLKFCCYCGGRLTAIRALAGKE